MVKTNTSSIHAMELRVEAILISVLRSEWNGQRRYSVYVQMPFAFHQNFSAQRKKI